MINASGSMFSVLVNKITFAVLTLILFLPPSINSAYVFTFNDDEIDTIIGKKVDFIHLQLDL